MLGDVIKTRTVLTEPMSSIAKKGNVIRGCSTVEMVAVFIKHGNAVRKSIRNVLPIELILLFLIKMVTTIVRTERMKRIAMQQRLQIYRMYQT